METVNLIVNNCTKIKDGYRVTLKCNESVEKGTQVMFIKKKATPLEEIYNGISRVFGIDRHELVNGGSDIVHTDARKVYSQIRIDMGFKIADIARELGKHRASIVYFLSDHSDRIKQFKEEVLRHC